METFKIKFSDKVQEDININIFKEEMKKILNDSYLNFPLDHNKFNENEIFNKNRFDSRNINTNLFSKQGSYNYDNNFPYSGKDNYSGNNFRYEANKEYKFCIFFGDDNKIKAMIQIIQEKLKFIFLSKKGQNFEKGFYQGNNKY